MNEFELYQFWKKHRFCSREYMEILLAYITKQRTNMD